MNTKAITLIEILIILVIIGLVAALTFPSMFNQISRHRAQMVFEKLKDIQAAVEQCGVENDYMLHLKCWANGPAIWNKINFTNPSDPNFTYSIPSLGDADGSNSFGTYTITARRVGSSYDTISLIRSGSTVSCSVTASSMFLGIC